MDRTGAITAKFEQVCGRIMQDSRNELYLSMRYLDLALSALQIQVNTELEGIGTDGRFLFVHPNILADLYEADRRQINRVYLHCVLHCLLRHLWKQNVPEPARDRLWRIACDMAVESILDWLRYRCVYTGVSRLRMNWYEQLRQERKVLTAEAIWYSLRKLRAAGELSDFECNRLEQEFCVDDHSLWPDTSNKDMPDPQIQMLQDKWQDLSEKTQTEMETIGKQQSEADESLREQVRAENRERYDYASFLRRFAVLREEMHTDPDTFDTIFYTYGLSLYGNMPLIEPQEFREVKRIEEFVIVIDVSLSTSGQLVRSFLEQTYAVLSENETWLKKVHIRIIQCDDKVRADQKITCQEELHSYMEHLTLTGGGGTDFRPAFAYVQELTERGELPDLRGMLYFTDGHGIYPRRRPAWTTAFIFMEEDYSDVQVPPWAIRLVIPREAFEAPPQLPLDAVFV